jgi:excisionase family DNA binding protein
MTPTWRAVSTHLDELFAGYGVHLSVTELATVLGVTKATAYEYLQAGNIPSYRIGARWLILRDEVRDFIKSTTTYTPWVDPADDGASPRSPEEET